MKKFITAAIIAAVSATSAVAHGGGLNSNGCHTNHSNGTYHCHNNYTPSYGADMGDVIAGVVVLGLIAGIANEMDKAAKKKKAKKKPDATVKELQRFLNAVNGAKLSVDGFYGPNTEKAIYAYYSHYPYFSYDGKFSRSDLDQMQMIYKPQNHYRIIPKKDNKKPQPKKKAGAIKCQLTQSGDMVCFE